MLKGTELAAFFGDNDEKHQIYLRAE